MKSLTKKELLLENLKIKKALRQLLNAFEESIVEIHPLDWVPGKQYDSWTMTLEESYKALKKDKNKAIIELKRRQYFYHERSLDAGA